MGCAVIISNRGGLPETITDGIILKKLNSNHLFNEIETLIKNKKKLIRLQKNSIKNFYLDNKFISLKIDNYRNLITYRNKPLSKNKDIT